VAILLPDDQYGHDFHQDDDGKPSQKHVDHKSVSGLGHSFVCAKQRTQKVFIGEPQTIKQSRGSTVEGPPKADKGPTKDKEALMKANEGPTKARESEEKSKRKESAAASLTRRAK